MNRSQQTRQPRPHARIVTPSAAPVLPLPSPVKSGATRERAAATSAVRPRGEGIDAPAERKDVLLRARMRGCCRRGGRDPAGGARAADDGRTEDGAGAFGVQVLRHHAAARDLRHVAAMFAQGIARTGRIRSSRPGTPA